MCTWASQYMRCLFGSLEQGRPAGTELVEQCRLVGLGGAQVTLLHVTEAADLFRNTGECHGDMMVVRSELIQDLRQHRFVVGDKGPLGASLDRIAEGIECGAAQPLELRQEPEHREHPRAERNLARLAGYGI